MLGNVEIDLTVFLLQADDTIDEDVVAGYCYMYSEFHVPDTFVVGVDGRNGDISIVQYPGILQQ